MLALNITLPSTPQARPGTPQAHPRHTPSTPQAHPRCEANPKDRQESQGITRPLGNPSTFFPGQPMTLDDLPKSPQEPLTNIGTEECPPQKDKVKCGGSSESTPVPTYRPNRWTRRSKLKESRSGASASSMSGGYPCFTAPLRDVAPYAKESGLA